MLIGASQVLLGYRAKGVVRAERVELSAGQCLGVFGPNGIGKSTLLRGLTGLLTPMQGQVRVDRTTRIAYVPQHRSVEAHWPMTAFDAAAMQVSARSALGWIGGGRNRRVREAMRELDVEGLRNQSFATLSGGQQQRVMLAGALASEPAVLVFDEPTEGLDLSSRRALLDLLIERKKQGLAILLVSHELEDLIEVSDVVAWLHPGESPEEPSRVEQTTAHEVSERLARAPAGRAFGHGVRA